jgi:hypothetical protein
MIDLFLNPRIDCHRASKPQTKLSYDSQAHSFENQLNEFQWDEVWAEVARQVFVRC